MTRRRLAVSFIASVLLVAAAAAVPRATGAWGERLQVFVLFPGFVPASVAWPEGAHTGAGATTAGVWIMFATVYVGAVLFWMLVFNAIGGLWKRTTGAAASE